MSDAHYNNISTLQPAPRVVPRADHGISREQISDAALKVLYRLKNAGFRACLVGGSVRDLMLGREPKDFDVVTDARPQQVRELFRNSRLIGRRFRLAHVRYGPEIIEVSTFRAPHKGIDNDGHSVAGRIIRDNVYGNMDDDVWRRDFTVNALFYDIADFSVIDYVNGTRDIKAGLIRLIGDPEQRYVEDPVRLLRAVRFATKLGFKIEPASEEPISRLAGLLAEISPSRLFEETLKLFFGGCALQTFEALRHHDLFVHLFPQTDAVLAEESGGFPRMLIKCALENSDERMRKGKSVTPGFLLAAFLWLPMMKLAREHLASGLPEAEAIELASDVVISRQVACTAVPRRFTQMAREIWQLQPRFARRTGKRPERLFAHPRFRAAYDFLLLRAQAREAVAELADWWTRFQVGREAPAEVQNRPRKRRRRRRSRAHHSP